jgi:hypothetical protein
MIHLGYGDRAEVWAAEQVPVTRQPDSTIEHDDPVHVYANVRVLLRGEAGYFAFALTPETARLLASSVERHCPDAPGPDLGTPSRRRRGTNP